MDTIMSQVQSNRPASARPVSNARPVADDAFANFGAMADSAVEKANAGGGKKYEIKEGYYILNPIEFVTGLSQKQEKKYQLKFRINAAISDDFSIDETRDASSAGATVSSHHVYGAVDAETRRIAMETLAISLKVMGADMSAIVSSKTLMIEAMDAVEQGRAIVAWVKPASNGKNFNIFPKPELTDKYRDSAEDDALDAMDMFSQDEPADGEVYEEEVEEEVVAKATPALARRRA